MTNDPGGDLLPEQEGTNNSKTINYRYVNWENTVMKQEKFEVKDEKLYR